MKILTIKQPCATLIMQGDKRFEFRSWKTIPYGKILGKVKLVDCIKMSPEFKELLLKENSNIYAKSSFQEYYGWQLSDVEVFEKSIESKGYLSLWEYKI